ncbi:MAG: hypothetical protein ACRDMV_15550 [Streptosporangiales bacterium]
MRSWQVRRVANWLNLSTPFGLLVAAVGRAEVVPGPRGLLLAGGYRPSFPIARAFTVGSVVVTGRPASWLTRRPLLLRHEERHANQWAACGGLPFLPLYAAAMAVSVWRRGDRASGNVFERLAGLADGGYQGDHYSFR